MKFTIKGHDEPYELEAEKITFAEAKAIEAKTGKEFGEASGIAGMQGMFWIAMKRRDPTLKFSDLEDMPFGDFDVEDEDEDEDKETAAEVVPTETVEDPPPSEPSS